MSSPSNDCAFDISGEFAIDEERASELGNEVLTERQIGKTFYSLEFQQVQSGTFKGEPAWLLVVDAKFHSSNSEDVRFKAAEIVLDFGGKSSAVKGNIKAFAPSMLYGAPITEHTRWHWEVAASTNISLPPATIELARATIGHSTEYPIRHMLKLQGTERGIPRSKVVWSVEERKTDGIPARLPPLAVIVSHPPNSVLQLSVTLTADTGFSLNPRRWPMFSGPKKIVSFDPHGRRQGSPLQSSALEDIDMSRYVKDYLADASLLPAASAFDG